MNLAVDADIAAGGLAERLHQAPDTLAVGLLAHSASGWIRRLARSLLVAGSARCTRVRRRIVRSGEEPIEALLRVSDDVRYRKAQPSEPGPADGDEECLDRLLTMREVGQTGRHEVTTEKVRQQVQIAD
jgi:hypothetical protein